MIHVSGLRYSYPPSLPGGRWQAALDDLSFEVARGACLAVTGANSSGKSTLCLALAGLAPRLTGGQLEGQITIAGRDVQAEPPGALAGVIGLVLQDPTGQLFNTTVEEEVAWGLENLGISPAEMRVRIDRTLDAVGLGDIPRDRPPLTLSGGEQKRLALAAALALQPRVLILDEPAGGLAPAARAEMVAVLCDLRAREALTVLFAENDPDVIAALADEVLVLNAGHMISQSTPASLYTSPGSRLLPGISVPPAAQFAAAANARRGLNLTCLTVEQAVEQARRHPLNGTKPEPEPQPEQPRAAADGAASAIVLEAVHFAYTPDRPVLCDINLSIRTGEFAALTGDNGAGKTTLAKHLIGLLRPTVGRVLVFGKDTAGHSVGQLARLVGFAFQNPELQIFSATVREEIAFGPRNLGMDAPTVRQVVSEALHRFGLEELAEHPPAVLSFSSRRMVALASIAAMNTPIVVLDEPTVGLDASGQGRVIEWLAARQQKGQTNILITHDMELAARVAQRVIVLDHGQIAADGSPGAVFSQGALLQRAGLQAPFARRFADALGSAALAADLTPQGAAQAWVEALQ
jgi:energy-coupling factor transport system ATP-binding protein